SAACLAAGCAAGPVHDTARHEAGAPDSRLAVDFPEPLRSHTLANMRDHLAALQEIQQALAESAFDRAADVSEKRLGMTSLTAHGAHDLAKFMPVGMQAAGTEMHRSASRFSVEAANAGATGNVKPALAALARLTQQCVACHSGYRMK
ncbi:MAG TPA: hypothetical protein VFV55_02910, partial [Usitatibacteraceae bacterium]|nr:hypothetical protein [Usitatibacteraceae bacterium]